MERWENDALDLYYQSRREHERKRVLYFIMQKLAGVLCIGVSALDAVLLQDLTVGTIFVPVGLYLIFTRERVVR